MVAFMVALAGTCMRSVYELKRIHMPAIYAFPIYACSCMEEQTERDRYRQYKNVGAQAPYAEIWR